MVWKFVRIRSGATIDETATIGHFLLVYDNYGTKVYPTDPNTGLAWTQAGIDALEAGIGSNNAGIGRATKLITEVAYGPPFPAGRARINPSTLIPAAVEMLNAGRLGG